MALTGLQPGLALVPQGLALAQLAQGWGQRLGPVQEPDRQPKKIMRSIDMTSSFLRFLVFKLPVPQGLALVPLAQGWGQQLGPAQEPYRQPKKIMRCIDMTSSFLRLLVFKLSDCMQDKYLLAVESLFGSPTQVNIICLLPAYTSRRPTRICHCSFAGNARADHGHRHRHGRWCRRRRAGVAHDGGVHTRSAQRQELILGRCSTQMNTNINVHPHLS